MNILINIFRKIYKKLKKYPYIKDVNTNTNINNQLADINIDIDEETKNRKYFVSWYF